MELQMTLEADYAVRIVYELASSGGRIDASALAEASGVTVRFFAENSAETGSCGADSFL